MLAHTLLRLQLLQPSRGGDGTARQTQLRSAVISKHICTGVIIYTFFFCMCEVILHSYPPSLPCKGGSTRAAPARLAAVRGDRGSGVGAGATFSSWLSFSALGFSSSGSSPPPVSPPPVLFFNWALNHKRINKINKCKQHLFTSDLRRSRKHDIQAAIHHWEGLPLDQRVSDQETWGLSVIM